MGLLTMAVGVGVGGASCGLLGCELWDGVVDGRGGGDMAGGRWRL